MALDPALTTIVGQLVNLGHFVSANGSSDNSFKVSSKPPIPITGNLKLNQAKALAGFHNATTKIQNQNKEQTSPLACKLDQQGPKDQANNNQQISNLRSMFAEQRKENDREKGRRLAIAA